MGTNPGGISNIRALRPSSFGSSDEPPVQIINILPPGPDPHDYSTFQLKVGDVVDIPQSTYLEGLQATGLSKGRMNAL
jgi:hypothetical protein